MDTLNLPTFPFRFRTSGQSKEIFDTLRKKYVVLTPEEWVRQHFIMYLRDGLNYPAGYISVEKGLLFNDRKKRTDIVVHDSLGKPWMIVECKAPTVKLTENAFYQAASYHLKLDVKYLVVTNGLTHFCCKFENENFVFSKGFPEFGL
ncbi:MAG: type I restriction enzyme HsdR N-terminal domain-containing protein [Bacteroidota bacterium]|nr:type I restriction enzyme HsdR N-terminal domain-containing protein [Bacteroidota bacterium]